jgi:very-short-patch-repair endonuclease
MAKRVRGTTRSIGEAANILRKQSTAAERVLWDGLRGRRLAGLKFRRQHPLGLYIVDFCCPERNLIVEVDGEVHANQSDYDATRTEHLNAYGYQVLRFTNADVFDRLDLVLNAIEHAATQPINPQS